MISPRDPTGQSAVWPAPGLPSGRNAHHALTAHEVVLLLETDVRRGLGEREADVRLRRFGSNELAEAGAGGAFGRLIRQINHPLVYVLLVSAAVALLLGENVDAAVIFGVVAANTVIGYFQESKAEAALDALRQMTRTEARVRRDGRARHVLSRAIVPGDLVLLEAGDRVPADLRLVEVAELRVDESALTGESLPVDKDEVALPLDTPVADRHNMVYSGTLVAHGAGAGVAVATGEETELGEIHRLVSSAEELDTPLTRKLAHFSKVLTVVILALAAATFLAGIARGEKASAMFSAAVALAVGAIPEGLPAAVTVTLAIGMARLARRQAVIRHLPAVETLGSVTVICSDKTGTLTKNEMTVRELWTPTGAYRLPTGASQDVGPTEDGTSATEQSAVAIPIARTGALEGDAALRWTLVIGATCNDARLEHTGAEQEAVGDPTEVALLVAARRAGLDDDALRAELERRETSVFSSERQYMATLHERAGGRVVFAKGAVERIVDLCDAQLDAAGRRTFLDKGAVLEAAAGLAARGLRVLATAMTEVPGGFVLAPAEQRLPPLSLTGLQAMLDPPRPEAIAAVAACQRAGISVKMITGDHAATAAAIAEQLAIAPRGDDAAVLTGADLARLQGEEYAQAVGRARVFARVSPAQKLRLVKGLQEQHHVIAMTGDGVNDAPALRQADIGVAMGRGGTEVAKDAADMVLLDDNFATIEAAVEEGRGVFDNLVKFIAWTLPTNMGEGFVLLIAIMLGTTLPLMPVQILWINMTTAVALGLMLAFEPKEAGIMTRRPRDPTRSILTGALLIQIVLVSGLLVGAVAWLFHWEQASGASLAAARTAALNLFVVVEIIYLFACRSLRPPAWHVGLPTNRWVLGGVVVQCAAQAAITYLPPMNSLFGTAPISAGSWLRIALLAAGAAVVVALERRLRRTT